MHKDNYKPSVVCSVQFDWFFFFFVRHNEIPPHGTSSLPFFFQVGLKQGYHCLWCLYDANLSVQSHDSVPYQLISNVPRVNQVKTAAKINIIRHI